MVQCRIYKNQLYIYKFTIYDQTSRNCLIVPDILIYYRMSGTRLHCWFMPDILIYYSITRQGVNRFNNYKYIICAQVSAWLEANSFSKLTIFENREFIQSYIVNSSLL